MQTGMLWLDDDRNRSFEDKLERAAEYYFNKYGIQPNMCMVHTTTCPEATEVHSLQVVPTVQIRPQHFWIGVHQA